MSARKAARAEAGERGAGRLAGDRADARDQRRPNRLTIVLAGRPGGATAKTAAAAVPEASRLKAPRSAGIDSSAADASYMPPIGLTAMTSIEDFEILRCG